MKLFFDENLSPRLVKLLSHEYPGSSHVRFVDMVGSADGRIWNYCEENNFTIVSKDTDFRSVVLRKVFHQK
jgi:predicted nuclease of predicted toxin-antitoxin system